MHGVYHVDPEKVKLVAIAHDIAKELTNEQIKQIRQKYNIQLDEIETTNKDLIHAKIGAYLMKKEYHFTDDMVNSIAYHTTGRAEMSLLEKIIYLADATEETREYCSHHYVDIIKKDIDQGIVEIQKWVIGRLMERNKLIHPNSIECYNYYTEHNKSKNESNE